MNIITHKKIFLLFSLVLVLASLFVVAIRGVDYSIEFTGGSVLEINYEVPPTIAEINSAVLEAGFDAQVQTFGENNFLIKTTALNEEARKNLINATEILAEPHGTVERFNSIGPSIGKELMTKSIYALIFVALGIVLFVAYAFRRVSKPVSSWKYGLVAVIALLHDILIPIGILTLFGTEIDTLYVVGLLSILGLSVNDTIVVFDRIRENLEYNAEKNISEKFGTTVGEAINQTITRSVITSLTLIVVLAALFFIGPVATQTLSLVLLIGTVIGTYSSIFLASPLLISFVSKK